MKGPAGVGKSAVAQTCVEALKSRGKLGAAFFFSVNGRSKPKELFTTIAYQLSTQFPNYRDVVDLQIRRDKTIVYKTIASQFRELIIKPLQKLEGDKMGIGKRVPIFIDGLDECEDEDAQCEIIEMVSAAARDGAIPLCWAFFSRPEPHIEATFAEVDIALLCHKSILPISREADGEIELYLRNGFENILRRRNISLKSRWPPDSDIATLVNAAAGLFVYPATVLRLVASAGSFPEERLRAILAAISDRGGKSSRSAGSTSPFAQLDAMYTLIMQRISPEMLPDVLLFCAMLCFRRSQGSHDSRGVIIHSNTLGFSELKFKTVCNQLNAVLHFQDQQMPLAFDHTIDTSRPFQYTCPEVVRQLRRSIYSSLGGTISFYHKSFLDFLADPTRSGAYCVASPPFHNALFEHCLKLQLEYQESYCFQGSGRSSNAVR